MLGVWTSIPVHEGGLGFTSMEIGISLASWGLYLLPFYKFAWPFMISYRNKHTNKHFAIWHIVRFGLFLGVFHLACYPFLNAMARLNRVGMWVLLELVIMLGVFAINTYYLSLSMLINVSVAPEINGSINGLVTASVAVGKCVGNYIYLNPF